MSHAVLAKALRIEPQPDGGGMLRYHGAMHIFNGTDVRNQTGQVRAWCGTKVASVDLAVVEDRSQGEPLSTRLCKRCFLEVSA